MDAQEIEKRINGAIVYLHMLANPPHRPTVGELKTEIRHVRDQLRELLAEMGGNPR